MSLLDDLLTGRGPHQDHDFEKLLGDAVDVGARAAEGLDPGAVELARLAARASLLHLLAALGIDTAGVTIRSEHAPVIERVQKL